MIVAVDGPAGSGKGTVTKRIEKELGFLNLDTGATYRCVALATLKNNVKLEEIEKRLMTLDDVNFTELFNEDASLKAVIDYYLRMRMTQGISPESFKDDVKVMYDEFYNNLDDILKSYK